MTDCTQKEEIIKAGIENPYGGKAVKIYALVIGKGSDYEIIEAFSGKAKADDAKNKFTDVTEYRGRCRVEELELDELVEPGCCYRFYTNAVLPWLWGSPCNTSHFVLWT